MDDYFAAKARLFTPAFTDRAVICTDDRWGRRLLALVDENGVDAHGYGLADAADLYSRRRARPSRGRATGSTWRWPAASTPAMPSGRRGWRRWPASPPT